MWRVVLACVVGQRPQENADGLLDRVKEVTDGHLPVFPRDHRPASDEALLQTYGVWVQPARPGDRGRYPPPRLVPTTDRLYAQVVKGREPGRVTEVKTTVVFGTPEAIADTRAHASVSATLHTSVVERDHVTPRQSHRRLTRRTHGFSKAIIWCEKPRWLSMAYSHFVLPHHSVRQPLATPQPPRGTGTPKRWKPITPAMAAGMTDQVWTTTEWLSYRVPAQFSDQLSKIKPLFALPDEVHQGK